MARKNYSEEFRRQAVDLYESTPGATVRGVAEDLGIERGTLRSWLDRFGTGRKTAADGTATRSPLKRPIAQTGSGAAGASSASAGRDGRELTPQQRIAQLEVENARLRAETTKLATEREILRRAAKYFAGETNW